MNWLPAAVMLLVPLNNNYSGGYVTLCATLSKLRHRVYWFHNGLAFNDQIPHHVGPDTFMSGDGWCWHTDLIPGCQSALSGQSHDRIVSETDEDTQQPCGPILLPSTSHDLLSGVSAAQELLNDHVRLDHYPCSLLLHLPDFPRSWHQMDAWSGSAMSALFPGLLTRLALYSTCAQQSTHLFAGNWFYILKLFAWQSMVYKTDFTEISMSQLYCD